MGGTWDRKCLDRMRERPVIIYLFTIDIFEEFVILILMGKIDYFLKIIFNALLLKH